MKRAPVILVLLLCLTASAAEVIPPVPQNHFNDYAKVVPAATAERLNKQLADFERQTSNQIVVAVFPKMQSDSSIEDYATRVFTAWKVGQKGKNNGAVLFVFVQDRKMFIQTGYGLEGALPDALCKQIVEQEIKPRFQRGDFAGGLTAGVQAMLAATRGEYRGSGRTVREMVNKTTGALCSVSVPILVILILILMQRSTIFARTGRRRSWYWGPGYYGGWGTGGWGTGGGGWTGGGGGGFGGGGGGTFSSGGGSTGGGGAGGSW